MVTGHLDDNDKDDLIRALSCKAVEEVVLRLADTHLRYLEPVSKLTRYAGRSYSVNTGTFTTQAHLPVEIRSDKESDGTFWLPT